MSDDRQYQDGLHEYSPEQPHANDDVAKSCVEALVILVCAGTIAYLVRLFI